MAETNTNEFYSKPKFDGRLQYYQVIKELLDTFAISNMQNDTSSILRTLETIYFLSLPFIKHDDRISIDKDIKKAWKLNMLINKNKIMNSNVKDLLENHMYELKKTVMLSIKNLLLPTSEQNLDPMDDENFLNTFEKESDI